jgi:hypothetical protein
MTATVDKALLNKRFVYLPVISNIDECLILGSQSGTYEEYNLMSCSTFRPWRWKLYFPPKLLTLSELHGITNHNTVFILTSLNVISSLIESNSAKEYK